MIVISGALVLVALVLLIIGLVATSLPFVYVSIAVSVVSFVFLLIGILQRRGEELPETAGAEEPARPHPKAYVEGVTAIIPAGSRAAADPPAAAEVSEPVSGSVLVVAGRPRYHVSGCRYLTGKDPDVVDVQDARDEGFTACGVCKPDTVLAAAKAAPEAVAAPVAAARKTTEVTPTPSPGRRPAASATTAPAKKAAAKAPAKAPAKVLAKVPATSPTKTAKAPSKAAAAAAAASTPVAASALRRSGTVVVIPDRGKFHKADCRFVRDAADAEELTRAQATRQGYDACGVCKP